MKPNLDIRDSIRHSGLCTWQVAEKLGIHETTFYRRLRKELTKEEKQNIHKAIDELKVKKIS